MSREHMWPAWLKEFVPRESSHTIHVTTTDYDFVGVLPPYDRAKPGRLNRPGDPKSQRLRVVCQPCNNEWMSVLQVKVKPILLPLIEGRWETISAEQLATLSAWCTMFVMVTEAAHPETMGISPPQRRFLKDRLTPPSNWRILAAKYQGNRNGTFWHKALVVDPANAPLGPNGMPEPKGQGTVFVVGKVAFYAVSLSVALPEVDQLRFDPWLPLIQIWPRRTALKPTDKPFRIFDDHDYENIHRVLATGWRSAPV